MIQIHSRLQHNAAQPYLQHGENGYAGQAEITSFLMLFLPGASHWRLRQRPYPRPDASVSL